MKKIFALTLAITLALFLCACSSTSTSNKTLHNPEIVLKDSFSVTRMEMVAYGTGSHYSYFMQIESATHSALLRVEANDYIQHHVNDQFSCKIEIAKSLLSDPATTIITMDSGTQIECYCYAIIEKQ
jgi:hypothetical protein